MTWAGTYANVTSLAANDWFVCETNAGGGITLQASSVAYKGSDGFFHLGSFIIEAQSSSATYHADVHHFENAAGTLEGLTVAGADCIANNDLQVLGALSVNGSTLIGNAAGDTHQFTGPVTMLHALTVNGNAALGNAASDVSTFNGDANFTVTITSSKPRYTFDSGDWIEYDRSTNTFNFGVGSATVATIAAAGITAVAGTFTGNVSVNTGGGADQKLILGSVDSIVRNGSNGALTISTNAQGITLTPANSIVVVTGSIKPSSYTVATVPSASGHGAGAMIYVSNETGGATTAFSDATSWRRHSDRAVVA